MNIRQLIPFASTMILVTHTLCLAQTVPANRLYLDSWRGAGYSGTIPTPDTIVSVKSCGAAGDGSACDAAVSSAINALGGQPGVIFFPAGTYLLQNSLTVPSGVVFRGERSSNTLIQVSCDYDCIVARGTWQGDFQLMTGGYSNQSTVVTVTDGTAFNAGDYAEIQQNNDPAISWSTWATLVVGQLVRITAVNGNSLTLENGLRLDFSASLAPSIRKMLPTTDVGFENLKFERINPNAIANYDNKMTILFERAANGWVRGCEFYNAFGGHIASYVSTKVSITGNRIHGAFDDGGGGRGYGVRLESKTGEFRVENNILHTLRHSILFQVGCNGNVAAYNYSFDSTAGLSDITGHGNYPFANLVEGNICAFIHLDDSHFQNGPCNTFLRNKATSGYPFFNYAFYLNQSGSHRQAFVGHEGRSYSLGSSTGHIWHANNMNGTVSPAAAATNLPDLTYYLGTSVFAITQTPDFWIITNALPTIGPPAGYTAKTIPAKYRYDNGLSLTVAPPSLWQQPQNRTLAAGSALNLSVSATGTPVAVFQWYKDGAPVPSATNRTYQVSAVTTGDAGVYRCDISDDYGSISSAPATVSVAAPSTNLPGWIAYNDALLWTNETYSGRYSTNSPYGGIHGPLMNTNGQPLGATVSFDTSAAVALNFVPVTTSLPAGTDADSLFSGRIGQNNVADWASGTVVMTLENLNTGCLYDVALLCTRLATSTTYSDRWTVVTISGIDAFTNRSSTGATRLTTGMPGDTTRLPSSLADGLVARYDSIRPGSDGAVTFSLLGTGTNGASHGYLNGFMVVEQSNAAATGDADGDGMNDTWEQTYFGGTNQPAGGTFEDWDHDGSDNYSEYRAGTDPASSASRLAMTDVAPTNAAGTLVLRWAGVSGKTYSLLQSTNLGGAWSVRQSGIPGTAPFTSYTGTTANIQTFWRVRVE